jgi:hypothetical protein
MQNTSSYLQGRIQHESTVYHLAFGAFIVKTNNGPIDPQTLNAKIIEMPMVYSLVDQVVKSGDCDEARYCSATAFLKVNRSYVSSFVTSSLNKDESMEILTLGICSRSEDITDRLHDEQYQVARGLAALEPHPIDSENLPGLIIFIINHSQRELEYMLNRRITS